MKPTCMPYANTDEHNSYFVGSISPFINKLYSDEIKVSSFDSSNHS